MEERTSTTWRVAFRASLGTVLVGAGVLASCSVAGAASPTPRAYGDPEIARVNGEQAYTSTGGVDHFQTDDRNVGIWVDAHSSVHGDLVVRDDESGDVLCELPARAVDALADCPAFLGPGEHRVVGEVTTNGVTRTTAPAVIESYAPDAPSNGVAPQPVSVVGTTQGDRGGATAVTLRGAPGDRVILRDEIYDTALDTVFGDSGEATAQVYMAEGVTAQLPVETQRDGRRWTGTVPVTANPKPRTHAEPLELLAVEQASNGLRTIVLRGTPRAWYQLQVSGSSERVNGTVPDDGVIRWQPHSRGDALRYWTQGEDGEQVSGSLDLSGAPVGGEDGDEQPADPVVAVPGTGVQDPGFTVPVVAQPGAGPVDPGFTVPAAQAPGEIALVGVEPTATAGVARVIIEGTAGDTVTLTTTTGRFWWSGRLDQDGRASFDVWDFPNGGRRTFTGTVSHDGHERPVSFEATSNARQPVHAEPLEHVDTSFAGGDATVTFRGTPGASYRFAGPGAGPSTGTVPADGLVRFTARLDSAGHAELFWHTIGDDQQSHHGTFSIDRPVTADPSPGVTDPGFTAPGGGGDTAEPGDGDDTAEPGDGGDTGQPGDGAGDEDGTPASDVSAEIVTASVVTERGALRVQDRSLPPYESYYAGVFLDGKQTEAIRVTGTLRTETVRTGAAGPHTLELRKDGEVLATVEYTVPDTSSSADPTDQFATALVSVSPVTKRVSYTVQDTGLADPLDRYLVGVWVDGHQVAATSVDRTIRSDQFTGGAPGVHRAELRAKDGRVLGGFEYTVPGGSV